MSVFSKNQAIERINQWSKNSTPFLFVIDYEMDKILLYPNNDQFPSTIRFCFETSNRNNFETQFSSFDDFSSSPIQYSEYLQSFQYVLNNIYAGNSFLTNLTFASKIKSKYSLIDFYNSSKAKYKLLVDNQFVCFSPETFVKIYNGRIYTYPMKGTIRADIPNASEVILNNPKEIAEHHTIVDLLRNDISMIATDVTVNKFRYIDRLQTNKGDILQVSSEISGKLPANFKNNLGDILFTLLPAGSVTGAPKQKTLQIIQNAEKGKRGYYTGVCGYFDGQNLDSAVMIRFIEIQNDGLWYRSGGGITCNSDPLSEYNELIDKIYVPTT